MSVMVLIEQRIFFFDSNPKRFRNIIKSEKLLRRVDDVYLIDSLGNIIFSDTLGLQMKNFYLFLLEDDFNEDFRRFESQFLVTNSF